MPVPNFEVEVPTILASPQLTTDWETSNLDSAYLHTIDCAKA